MVDGDNLVGGLVWSGLSSHSLSLSSDQFLKQRKSSEPYWTELVSEGSRLAEGRYQARTLLTTTCLGTLLVARAPLGWLAGGPGRAREKEIEGGQEACGS